ncbi:WD40-repeat-containing domain protein [Pisolithus croceorrhizus]|nr:WD40-repeat-containing domain protein [Pisolithus croceorrhizus]
MLQAVAVDALQLAIPLATAIPLLGSNVRGILETVLFIVQVKDDVKMKKAQCQLLAERVVTISAAITTELMKADPATLARRENSVVALLGTLRRIQTFLQELTSASLARRIFNRGDVGGKLTLFRQQLDTAIDVFHITEDMRTEDALTLLSTAVKEGEDKRDILLMNSLLRPVATASYLARAPGSGCFAGTRKSLIDQISTWFNKSGSQVPQMFWLSGLGGTGKTAVSHTVCEKMHANGQLGASFFFSRDEADRRRVASIIPTLAFQLASVNSAYRRKLCDVLKAHPDAPSHAQQYQLKELLLDPLKEVPSLPPYLIVLDALDECDKERAMEGGDLIPLILRELPNSGLNIKVLITSRPERSIKNMFNARGRGMKIYDTSVLHDMDQSVVKEDIASYLTYHLQRIQADRNLTPPWPGDQVLNNLVTRAGLFFIFAATIVNFVADTYYSPRAQLQRLLYSGNSELRATYMQVDFLYSQVLRISVEGRVDASELCVRFVKIVGAIVLLQDPLSISALAHLLAHDVADLEGALSPLHSLLDVPSDRDEPVRIFHPSFRDFLLIQGRCQDSRFAVSEGRTHTHLALCCLKVMLRHLKRNICDIGDDIVLNSEIPDLEKKLRKCIPPELSDTDHWKELIERLSEFTSTKLLYWIEALSLEGRFPLCISNLVTVIPWCKANAVGPKISNLIYDAYRLVLDFHQVIDVSAVQLYHSALIFIPNCSLLHAYQHELPRVRMTTPRTDEWDVSLLVLEGHRSSVNMASFSREGSRAASASDDGDVRIWDTLDGGQVSCLKGHEGAVKSVEYSPDSSFIVSGGSDATIRLWDAVTGFNISTLTGHKGCVNSAIFSSDGCNIVSASEDSTLCIWDTLENKLLASLNGHSGPVTCVTFLADGSRILSGSVDSTIRLWDLKTKSTVEVLHCASAILSLAVSPPLQNPIFLSGSQDGVITIRDVGSLKEVGHLIGHAAAIKSVTFSSHGEKVVSGSSDGAIRVWDAAGRSCVAEYRGHSGPVECTRFTPDGTRILSSSTDRSIRMWDASVEGVHGLKEYVMTVQITDNLEHVVSGSTDGKFALWKTSDGSMVYEVNVHRGIIHCLALSHDDKAVASGSADHTICILNMDNGSNVATFEGHTDEVYTVEFSSNSSLLVSASQDGQAKIWDVSTRKLKRSFTHSNSVGGASFSPDDKLICSGTMDGAVYVWNVETGHRVAILNEYPSPVLCTLFSPNGKWLVSWFEDEAVKVWKVQGTKFQPSPYQEWRLDRRTDIANSRDGKELPKYDDLLPSDEPLYLQEDGWVTSAPTGKRICWVPPSRRQPWLRTLWESLKGIFITGSQAGVLTIVDLTFALE